MARAFGGRLLLASAYSSSPHRAESVLQASLRGTRAIWPTIDARAVQGPPADALVTLARDENAGLLVVGNKGMTGTARLLLGSVPDRVSHNAPCDLLIVKTTGAPARRSLPYRKVLLATDASQTSLQAVRRGLSLSAALGATPVLFYAGHPKTAEIVFREVAREFLPAATLQTASAAGDPADVITEVARSGGYDLVVMGNKGMLGRGPHFGVVPNKVSHLAPTDLLIVKTVSASISDLRRGEGAVITLGKRKWAVFVDDDGTVHRLSPRCSHMGCTVDWNADERTWDCPCHGSRYDARGGVIRGPAGTDLTPLEGSS
ncbi:MAG TPA: universal stress protein [Candidatus Limnocylindria bacterium]|nr:universal stress protein [Candidatus Limnocylindria bacterium]